MEKRAILFRKPSSKEWVYIGLVLLLYGTGVGFVYFQGLSFEALFFYGLLQAPGITGESARIVEIATPLSWNLLEVCWFVVIKGAAVLVELLMYWVIGMLIAGALVAFVSWEKIKEKWGMEASRQTS